MAVCLSICVVIFFLFHPAVLLCLNRELPTAARTSHCDATLWHSLPCNYKELEYRKMRSVMFVVLNRFGDKVKEGGMGSACNLYM